jgi:small subunit ribosomal protein S14
MAKKSLINRNSKRYNLFQFYKSQRRQLISIRNNKFIALKYRFEAQLLLSKITRNSCDVRIRNRCILSGRARGIYRMFNLSRIWIRILASDGKLPGITKSSW